MGAADGVSEFINKGSFARTRGQKQLMQTFFIVYTGRSSAPAAFLLLERNLDASQLKDGLKAYSSKLPYVV